MVRVAVVTGANKGIGFGIVKNLCQHPFNGDVVLCSRNEELGRNAVKQLNEIGLNPIWHQLDIDDEESIQSLNNFLVQKYGGVDVLVNNAAIAFKMDSQVPFVQQAEQTLKTNFFSTRNVCLQLFPILRSHGRVVNVSSSAGMLRVVPGEALRKKLSDPNLTEGELLQLVDTYLNDVRAGVHREKGWPTTAYGMSKVFLTALSFIQQRQFNADSSREDVVVNAVHPGYVDTDMTSHKGPLTIEQGADAPSYLALLPPNVREPVGSMVWFDRKIVDWESD